MSNLSQAPEYVCHKVVRALVIKEIAPGPDPGSNLVIHFESDAYEPYEVTDRKLFARYTPVPGDYLVMYDAGTDDSYVSVSPKKQFDEGYELAGRGLTRRQPSPGTVSTSSTVPTYKLQAPEHLRHSMIQLPPGRNQSGGSYSPDENGTFDVCPNLWWVNGSWQARRTISSDVDVLLGRGYIIAETGSTVVTFPS